MHARREVYLGMTRERGDIRRASIDSEKEVALFPLSSLRLPCTKCVQKGAPWPWLREISS